MQVRNRGTIGGSLAEADPSGDWATALMTLETEVRCQKSKGDRWVQLADFIKDAYTTALAHDELVSEVVVKIPPQGSGGAYLAFKRSAPVYPTASAAVQLTMDGEVCKGRGNRPGLCGADRYQSKRRGRALRGQQVTQKTMATAVEAARAAAEPQSDMRGSADYKRTLVGSLVKRRSIRRAARPGRADRGRPHLCLISSRK